MLHKKLFALLILAFLFSACSGYSIKPAKVKGVYHRVKSGETLWQIAKAYNINLQELAEGNNIVDPNIIKADSVIFIPDANQVIDDVMSSVKLAGASLNTAKVEKIERPPYRSEAVKDKSVKQSAVTFQETIAPKDNFAAKNAQIVKESKTVEKQREVNKDEARATTTVQDELISGTGISLKGLNNETRAPIKEIDIVPPKAPEKKVIESKTVENKPEAPAKLALEGTISSGLQFDKKRFIWPLQGKVISRFGIQPNGLYLNGIKIAAKEGTQVYAAAAGTVIFSASLKGYGETIIIKHEDNFATVYTHLYNRIVNVEDRVKKGDKIALLGKFNKEGEAYLNFEIRYNNKARNPLFFLP